MSVNIKTIRCAIGNTGGKEKLCQLQKQLTEKNIHIITVQCTEDTTQSRARQLKNITGDMVKDIKSTATTHTQQNIITLYIG